MIKKTLKSLKEFLLSILIGLVTLVTTFFMLYTAAFFDGWKEFFLPLIIFLLGCLIYVILDYYRKND